MAWRCFWMLQHHRGIWRGVVTALGDMWRGAGLLPGGCGEGVKRSSVSRHLMATAAALPCSSPLACIEHEREEHAVQSRACLTLNAWGSSGATDSDCVSLVAMRPNHFSVAGCSISDICV